MVPRAMEVSNFGYGYGIVYAEVTTAGQWVQLAIRFTGSLWKEFCFQHYQGQKATGKPESTMLTWTQMFVCGRFIYTVFCDILKCDSVVQYSTDGE